MKSRTTQRFREAFADLPTEVQRLAREAYSLFRNDTSHPSLQFKRVHASLPIFSVRIGIHYRAVGIRDADEIIWYWIGSHADYDKLLKQM